MYREKENIEFEAQGPTTRMEKFRARYDLWEPNAGRILVVHSVLLGAIALGSLYFFLPWQVVTKVLHAIILFSSWIGGMVVVTGSFIFLTDSSNSTIKKQIWFLPLTVIGVLMLISFTYVSVNFIFPYYNVL